MLKSARPPFVVYKKGDTMEKVRPIYKNLLIAAIALFVIGVAFALSDIYQKIGNIEHASMHRTPGAQHEAKSAK